jgi:hypothetical protein
VENNIAIRNNLSADWVYQRFKTPRRAFKTKQIYSWTEERLACHIMLQTTLIISHEM